MSKLKFNNKKIYDSALFYKECSLQLDNIRKRMQEISNEIGDSWKGADSEIYISQYNNYINYLKNVSVFLENKSELLSKASNLHNDIDNELCEQFKRSNIDEQDDRY